MEHGFAKHGRDYMVLVEIAGHGPGLFRLTFTHIVELRYTTRVRDDVWRESWDDEFLDYNAWRSAGEPEGYIWGTNWSNAWPGITAHSSTADSASWTERLGKPMHSATIETDRFSLTLIFHDLTSAKLSEEAPTLRQVQFPLD